MPEIRVPQMTVPEELEDEITRRLRAMTIEESVGEWLALQRAFEPQLRETEALFAPERRAALAELQTRLQRLVEWQRNTSNKSLERSSPITAVSCKRIDSEQACEASHLMPVSP
jgi:hypothetical protein